MLRVCILGAGSFGRVHARWWRAVPGAELVAVASRNPEELPSDDAWRGLRRRSYEDVFANPDGIDLLDIVTPSALHSAHAIRALTSGLHVLVEKPMATTRENAEAMINAARESNRRLFVVSQYRYVPAYRVVSSAVAAAGVSRARFEYVMPPEAAGFDRDSWKCDPALSGGGILFGSGIHLVDLLVHWFSEPAEVESRIAFDTKRRGIETDYEARWRGAKDERVEIVSRVETGAGHTTRLDLEFAGGKAVIENRRIVRGSSPLSWKLRELALGVREKIIPWRRDPLGRQFSDIVRAVSTGDRAEVEGEEGLRALRTILRIRDSVA